MKKIRKIIINLIAGVALLALIAFNIQISTNSGDSSGINLAGLNISVFTPTAVATVGNCIYANYRVGGVCSGATERLCEGPPACPRK